eukprot:PhF_6_TR4760/c0_g1_i1/m.6572
MNILGFVLLIGFVSFCFGQASPAPTAKQSQIRITTTKSHTKTEFIKTIPKVVNVTEASITSPAIDGYKDPDTKFVFSLEVFAANQLRELIIYKTLTPPELKALDVDWAEVKDTFAPEEQQGFEIWMVAVAGAVACLVFTIVTCIVSRSRAQKQANVVTFTQMAKLEDDLYAFPYSRSAGPV